MEDKKCSKCNKIKTLDNFTFRKDTNCYRNICHECRRKEYHSNEKLRKNSITKSKLYYENNSDYVKNRLKEYRKNNIEKEMIKSAKYRAKKQGVPFSITEEDIIIPNVCPVLGIKLMISDGHCTANSPTLDKVVPSKGYVKGNIIVVSHKANTIKNDATLEEIKKVYDFYNNIKIKSEDIGKPRIEDNKYNITEDMLKHLDENGMYHDYECNCGMDHYKYCSQIVMRNEDIDEEHRFKKNINK